MSHNAVDREDAGIPRNPLKHTSTQDDERKKSAHPHDASQHVEQSCEGHEKGSRDTPGRARKLKRDDVIKFVGLLVFFALMVLICVFLWPYLSEIFEPGGIDRVINQVRDAGSIGFLILLGLQLLQIIVAFIPGEAVQIAAGLLYGPWLGSLIILIGCMLSSAFIFLLVHKLGAPFVQSMVPAKYLEKFREFEKTGKLNIVVFALFLIPGLPKDVFTYLVPLTDMNMRTFIGLSSVGRLPGILVSTYAADGLINGRITESVIMFIIATIIVILGFVFQKRIIKLIERRGRR